MTRELSAQTIKEYIPAIKTVLASTEVGLVRYPELASQGSLRTLHLEKELGSSNLTHAMHIMNSWLEGTEFRADFRFFHKLGRDADWDEMVALLNAKVASYGSLANAMEIILEPSGRISREAGGIALSHDLADGGLKLKTIEYLTDESGRFVPTSELQEALKSRSTDSVLKTISKINSALKAQLRLPEKQKFIETKRGTGHRINPAYNVVRTRRA